MTALKSETNATGAYSFKQFQSSDLRIIKPWLLTPAVKLWYPDSDYIEDLEEHLEDARIQMQLVCFKGQPFAYVQDYDIHGWEDHHLSFLPPGSRGLDSFIGKPDMIGCGHGTNYIRLIINSLFKDGVPALGIDPHPDNGKAIRAYEKVGFKRNKTVSSEWGDCLLMSILRPY